MMKAEEKILSVIDKHRMIENGDTIVIGVSGGADSMCLLHFFNSISSCKQLNIICAHINHGIRGDEANKDEAFVRDYCNRHGIEFVCAHYDVPSLARNNGESEELCGRRLRYGFFEKISPGCKIATAHNLNDCMETFLFNLARGTGLRGLTGIPAVRGNIIRPLIECTRDEIEDYLKRNDVLFVTDSTNLCDDYSRNRIRHNVIPVMQSINEGFSSSFLNCIDVLRQSEEFLSEITCKAFDSCIENNRFSISRINEYERLIRNRLIIKIAEYYGAFDISAKHVELMNSLLTEKGAIMLHGKITVASDGEYIFKTQTLPEEPQINTPLDCSSIDGKKDFDFPGGRITVSRVDKNEIKNYNIRKLSLSGYADFDKLKSAVFRTRMQGTDSAIRSLIFQRSLKIFLKKKIFHLRTDGEYLFLQTVIKYCG